MNLGPFREVLARPPLVQLITVGMIARLPHAAAGILLTLHVVDTLGLGYAQSGIVAAAVTIGIAVGGPWRGRRIDQVGLRRALIPSIVAEMLIWTAAAHVPLWGLVPLAFLGGMLSLPVFSLVRQSLGVQTTGQLRRTTYTVDSMGTEIVFMIGPAAAVAIAASLSTTFGLMAVGWSAALAGIWLMILNPPTRSSAARRPDADLDADLEYSVKSAVAAAPANLGQVAGDIESAGQRIARRRMRERLRQRRDRHVPWLTLPVVATLITAAASGFVLIGTEVSIIANLRAVGEAEALGLVFVFWCGASVIGGLVYAVVERPISPMILLALMGVTAIPMLLARTPWELAWWSIPTGLFCAPTLSSASERLSSLVSEEVRGEAMGWYGSAMTIGTAAGSPLVGLVIDAGHPAGAYVVTGVVGLVVGGAGLLARQRRRTVLTRGA
ncbi:MFS transporter [Falsarthrobacter nasiphocae]|uniref:MFS family arabinose efflux permease n=1 Tax=Falsarthrobacter nasiphocae TaxID=189863 RepID=A0AAE4C7M4_9MICC|nr:MFS transporter [Falsarthrobacter nasiphocae]MDR6892689.1 putative MFS family arabinose efflux permease [Falsarthrobacter nasiphocae]